MHKQIKAVIFDMDGVLVDSERLYLRFWREACNAFGFDMSEAQALSLRSNAAEEAIPKFKAWFGESADYAAIRDTRRSLMASYIDNCGVALKDGAADILTFLKQHCVKTALATASPVKRAAHYLAPYGLFDVFDAIISGTDVAHGKPAPDIYLCAAHALGLSPGECIAVEDSPSGIRSAKSAGCVTVMIPDLTPPDEEILPLIDHTFASLGDIKTLISTVC